MSSALFESQALNGLLLLAEAAAALEAKEDAKISSLDTINVSPLPIILSDTRAFAQSTYTAQDVSPTEHAQLSDDQLYFEDIFDLEAPEEPPDIDSLDESEDIGIEEFDTFGELDLDDALAVDLLNELDTRQELDAGEAAAHDESEELDTFQDLDAGEALAFDLPEEFAEPEEVELDTFDEPDEERVSEMDIDELDTFEGHDALEPTTVDDFDLETTDDVLLPSFGKFL